MSELLRMTRLLGYKSAFFADKIGVSVRTLQRNYENPTTLVLNSARWVYFCEMGEPFKGGESVKTKHFNKSEFACKCCGKVIENPELTAVLELVRLKFGVAIKILSGTRCENHNAIVGGKKKSRHLTGQAADCYMAGVDLNEVYRFLCDTFPNRYGFGCYSKRGFIHIDVDPRKWRKQQ